MQKLHLVMGGHVSDPQTLEFTDLKNLDLVGVYVTNPEKVGKDAGDLVGLPKTGVLATNDEEAILAMDADCVLFAPSMMTPPIDMVCKLLASGKNVISPAGPFLPNKFIPDDAARVEEACRQGNSSFHGCGIHPGFAGDILPITIPETLIASVDDIPLMECRYGQQGGQFALKIERFITPESDDLAQKGQHG